MAGPAGLPGREELRRLGPAAVESLLVAFGSPETEEEACELLAEIPPPVVLDSLLHLLATVRFAQPAMEVLLRFDATVLANAVRILLSELGGGPAFLVARRCLDRLWPQSREVIRSLGDGNDPVARSARRYLASRDPLALQQRASSLYPRRQEVVDHLGRANNPWEVIECLARGRPWLASQVQARDAALWREYHGEIVVGCLLASGAGSSRAAEMLKGLLDEAETTVHLVRALALPECQIQAEYFLDQLRESQRGGFIGLWPESLDREDSWQVGLLENYLHAKGPDGVDRLAQQLDFSTHYRDGVALCVASLGAQAIPSLAKLAGCPSYSKGLLSAVLPMFAEVVAATLSAAVLPAEGLRCLGAAEFAAGEFTGPVETILRSGDFDAADWRISARRNAALLEGFPSSLSLRHALHLCSRWEVLPLPERWQTIRQIQDQIGRLLRWCEKVQHRELSDVYLTAQQLILEPRGKWYIKPPATPALVAARLSPELRDQLYDLKVFLRYLCQARIFGELKDFARETLALIP